VARSHSGAVWARRFTRPTSVRDISSDGSWTILCELPSQPNCNGVPTEVTPPAVRRNSPQQRTMQPTSVKHRVVEFRNGVVLVKDMGGLLQKGLCSNTSHPQLKLYFRKATAPFPHFELTPLNSSNEDIFVNQLKGALKKETGL
jgi:hypothetical protein